MYFIKYNNCNVLWKNGKYIKYFLYNIPVIEPDEIIILLYVNNYHFKLIYPKNNNQKNKKIYNETNQIDKSVVQNVNNKELNILKLKNE